MGCFTFITVRRRIRTLEDEISVQILVWSCLADGVAENVSTVIGLGASSLILPSGTCCPFVFSILKWRLLCLGISLKTSALKILYFCPHFYYPFFRSCFPFFNLSIDEKMELAKSAKLTVFLVLYASFMLTLVSSDSSEDSSEGKPLKCLSTLSQ